MNCLKSLHFNDLNTLAGPLPNITSLTWSSFLQNYEPSSYTLFQNCLVHYRHAIFIFRIFLREWDIIFEVWSSSSVTVVEFDDRFFNSEILKEFVVSRNKMTDNRRLFHYPSFCILRKDTLVQWNLGDWDFKPRLVWSKLAFLAVGRPWFARLGRFNVTAFFENFFWNEFSEFTSFYGDTDDHGACSGSFLSILMGSMTSRGRGLWRIDRL